MKNLFIEKTYVVGTSMRQFQRILTIYVTENKENFFFKLRLPSIMSIVLSSFKNPKLPISMKIPVALLQIVYICMAAISSH